MAIPDDAVQSASSQQYLDLLVKKR